MAIKDTEEKICCLLSLNDWEKAPLLCSIAKEEGVGYCQVRIPIEAELFDFTKFSMGNFKIIFSFAPNQVGALDFSREKTTNLTYQIVDSLLQNSPYALEINQGMPKEVKKELIKKGRKAETKLFLAKYYKKNEKREDLNGILKEGKEYDLLKVSAQFDDCYQALEFLSLGKKIQQEFILNPQGKDSKLAQIISPFLGSKFTYAYLSRRMEEAVVSISYLKKALEGIINTI